MFWIMLGIAAVVWVAVFAQRARAQARDRFEEVAQTSRPPARPAAASEPKATATAEPAPAAPQAPPVAQPDDGAVPAIFLKRHWPIEAPAPQRSALGGRPRLGDGQSWPVNPDTGFALHHLGQFDLSELPQIEGSGLPQTGLLSFYADINEEMLWEDGPDMSEAAVLYTADADAPFADVPETLPEAHHVVGSLTADRQTPRRTPQRVYPRWPVTGHRVETWSLVAYDGDIDDRMEADRQALTGTVQRRSGHAALMGGGAAGSQADWQPEALGGHFPWRVGLAKLVLDDLDQTLKSALNQSMIVREQAEKSGQPLDPNSVERFEVFTALRESLEPLKAAVAGRKASERADKDLCAGFDVVFSQAAANRVSEPLLTLALESGLQNFARRAIGTSAAKAVPSEAFDMVAKDLHPGIKDNAHYLLGAKGCKTNITSGIGIRLAQFDSDGALGFMFCDRGIIDFWISKEDLAAQRWDRAWAATVGG